MQFTSNSPREPTNGQVLLSPASTGTNSTLRTGAGMTKQELMKFANDPFWVRLRTFLFILFWVIWFAMLIGSIVIVAMAPGCPATASLPWWKKSSMANVKFPVTTETFDDYIDNTIEKIDDIKSNLTKLSALNIDTLIVGAFNPYILLPNELASNETREKIDEFRNKMISLAKNDDGIKIIADLDFQETFDVYSKQNYSEMGDVYFTQNDKLLLNYASPKAKELVKDVVLAWMKTKIEGIQTTGVFAKDPETGKLFNSKEAAADILKAVKSAGQNKVLLMINTTKDEPVENIFNEEDTNLSDMSPDNSLWEKLTEKPLKKLKESLDMIFAPYVKHEEQTKLDNNKTDADILVNRDNVGKYWRTYQMPLPESPNNPINESMREAAAMAMYMIPRSTPLIELDDKTIKNADSKVINKMLKLRKENPETFLAGRTILPKVKGSSTIFAVYRGAKKENGYLLLINEDSNEQIISIDSKELPYQDDIISKRVILITSLSNDSIGMDIILEQIKIQPQQAMLIEFSAK